jgi:hypothetical protein
MMASAIDATRQFETGVPEALFFSGALRINTQQVYAVMKDGKRFLVNARHLQSSVAPLTVVVNWTAAIQK